jgi:hypothetical protein
MTRLLVLLLVMVSLTTFAQTVVDVAATDTDIYWLAWTDKIPVRYGKLDKGLTLSLSSIYTLETFVDIDEWALRVIELGGDDPREVDNK